MKLLRLLFFYFSAISIAIAYGPIGEYGGIPHGGYSDSRINANTVVVSYDGNIFTPQHRVNEYALYRCAKVTLENGYDFFVITSTSMSLYRVSVQTRKSYNNYQSYPPKMHNSYVQSNQYQSDTVSFSQMEPPEENTHNSVIVIKMFQGRAPQEPYAYNAEDVIAHVGPKTMD